MRQTFWILGLLIIAAITASLQFDRQSRYDPTWSDRTPEPARYFAQANLTVRALQEDNALEAKSAAITLLSRRPVPAENLRLFAQAQIAEGDAVEALRSYQIAARRGWRDTVIQETMAQIAWAADDARASANRIAALYARGGGGGTSASIADDVFSDPAGRDQMAVLLAGPARWEAGFVRDARNHISVTTLNGILLEAHAKGARFSCAPLLDTAERQAREMGVDPSETELAPLLERNC